MKLPKVRLEKRGKAYIFVSKSGIESQNRLSFNHAMEKAVAGGIGD